MSPPNFVFALDPSTTIIWINIYDLFIDFRTTSTGSRTIYISFQTVSSWKKFTTETKTQFLQRLIVLLQEYFLQ